MSEPSLGLCSALCCLSEMPLPSVSLLIWPQLLSPVPAFGTHSSNITRLVSRPASKAHAVSCLRAFAHAVSAAGMPSRSSCLLCLANTY